jgi:hypothetical protein
MEKSMRWKLVVAALTVTTFLLGGYVGAAGADTTKETVGFSQLRDGDPDGNHPHLWYRTDTRTGGGVNLTTDFGGPTGFGNGALALTTNDKGTAKAQLFNTAVNGTMLSDISTLSYNTYHDGSMLGFEKGDPALQLVVDYNGGSFGDGGFTTLTFEPYLNGEVTPDVWQPWEADEGQWYTSRQITCDAYSLEPSSGDPAKMDTLAEIGAGCPNAIVAALGVNIGTSNESYIVATDGIHVVTSNLDLAYDFQPK